MEVWSGLSVHPLQHFQISVHQLQHVRNKHYLLLLLLLLEIGTARLTVFTAMDTCMSIEFSEVCDGTVNCQATSRGAGRRYRGGESMRNLPGEGHLSLVRQGMRCLFTIQPRPPGATSAGSQGSNPPCTPVSRNPRTYLNTDCLFSKTNDTIFRQVVVCFYEKYKSSKTITDMSCIVLIY